MSLYLRPSAGLALSCPLSNILSHPGPNEALADQLHAMPVLRQDETMSDTSERYQDAMLWGLSDAVENRPYRRAKKFRGLLKQLALIEKTC